MIDNEQDNFFDSFCPLLDLPCPQGEEAALQCRSRVLSNFDPMASFADLCILQCAQEEEAKMRSRTIRFCYQADAKS